MNPPLYTGEHSILLARLVAALHAGVRGTREELALYCHGAASSLRRCMTLIRPLGLIRIVAWRPNPLIGRLDIAVYGFGEGLPDCPRPPGGPRGIEPGPVNSAVAAAMLEELRRAPATSQAIAERVGSSHEYVKRRLRELHGAGHIHITEWTTAGNGQRVKVFAWGPGVDAPRPRRITPAAAQKNRRHRLIDRFGHETAARILKSRRQGGSDVVVSDGNIYRRGKPRGHRKNKEAAA